VNVISQSHNEKTKNEMITSPALTSLLQASIQLINTYSIFSVTTSENETVRDNMKWIYHGLFFSLNEAT
jgi:hypothetical protein